MHACMTSPVQTFGRWRGERFGRYRCLTLGCSLLLSTWVDPSAEHRHRELRDMQPAAFRPSPLYVYDYAYAYVYTYGVESKMNKRVNPYAWNIDV